MYDIFHEWGCDIGVGSGGDLALADGAAVISQRVCRRLLTNPGSYIWNLDYGGGLAQFVGTPASPNDIGAVVSTQLALEAAVPTVPAPQVSVSVVNSSNGYLVANITYADPSTRTPVILNVNAS